MDVRQKQPALRASLAAALLAVAVAPELALAAGADRIKGPVFSEHSNSYFELVKIKTGYSSRGPKIAEIAWEKAQKVALRRIHKGVRGRLAIVPDVQTTEFLKANFTLPEETWIGLRFWCRYRKLMWVTGAIHPLSGYKNWARPWKSKTTCAQNKFGAIYLGTDHKWRAHGFNKEWRYMLVEYSIPKEKPEEAPKADGDASTDAAPASNPAEATPTSAGETAK